MKKNIIIVIQIISCNAFAHVPIFAQSDSGISNPHKLERPLEKSRAVYAEFENSTDVDVFSFELTDDEIKNGGNQVFIGSLVPACEPLKNLLTSWVLVGPPSEENKVSVPSVVAEKLKINLNEVLHYEINESQPTPWREVYTAHNYFRQKNAKFELKKAGEYRVYIWSHNNHVGDYVFEFGDKEMWSISDIIKTLMAYPMLLSEKEIKTPSCKTD